MAEKQASLDEFLKNYEAQNEEDKDLVGSGEYEERETLRAERDQVYSGYYLESSQSGIEGKYGTNTAVRLTSPEGTKLTLWVNGYEEEHFNAFMGKLEKKGVSLPVKIDFLRTQEEAAKTGNTYNRLRIMEVASGEEVQFELDSL
ncbi:MAG: hypothetical protein VW715_04630 [Rhodospirillales bacterium]